MGYNKRFYAGFTIFILPILLFAQRHYDYMDDSAVAGGADRALNGIIITVVLVVSAIVLLFVISGTLNVYYWFNPKADPNYKREKARQDQERKHEEYVKEQRKNASPNAIDIGLSVKWASFNVGAYKPCDVGSSFYWAENRPSTIGHPLYNKIKEDVNVDANGNIGGDDRYDAATKIYGDNWRLPTDKECQELIDNCKWESKVIDGVEGRLIIGKNGNSIFLPFTQKSFTTGEYVSAHYWTSNPQFGGESAKDLRFGENCKQPAEIWGATANRCLFCIRPVFTTFSKEETDKLRLTETMNAYSEIHTNYSSPDNIAIDYKNYQKQCTIFEEEKEQAISPFETGIRFVEDKIQCDEHGVIYSLDGKRLLNGSNCDSETYRIKEGTEFICKEAFSRGYWDGDFSKKKTIIKKLILPSTLIYLPKSSIPNCCSIESLSPNYKIIDELLIDTRRKCVVCCFNRYIQKITIYEPIEEIGDYAFYNCDTLREVVLPNSIRKIGSSAFRWCELLCKINLPDSMNIISDYAFDGCKSLHVCNLPKALSSIGDYAFQQCIIDDIIIPNCIKEIGKAPFSKYTNNVISESSRFTIANSLLIDSDYNEVIQIVNSSIKQVSIPDYINKIRENAFIYTNIESIKIPFSVKELGDGIFKECKNLENVHINCNIERLPNSIFACCSSLSSFTVPESVKIIGFGAFYQCIHLQSVKLNLGLRIIENRAFDECINLVSLTIPDSIEKIGEDFIPCFRNCTNLKELRYDAVEAEIKDLPHSIINLTIGSHVIILPKYFLTNNSEIVSLVIPNNVQRIEKECISDCSNLKEISIFSKQIVIEEGWIRNCKNLRTIRIHANTYKQFLPLIPKEKNIKVKKIYDHHFL